MEPWSTSRKVTAWSFGAVAYGGLSLLAMYMAGVLFLLSNKANPSQTRITSIVEYWTKYSDDAVLRSG